MLACDSNSWFVSIPYRPIFVTNCRSKPVQYKHHTDVSARSIKVVLLISELSVASKQNDKMTKICKGLQHRPDSLFSWFVSVCACVCQALNLGFAISFGVLLPELMKEFGESRQKTGKFGRAQLESYRCTESNLIHRVFRMVAHHAMYRNWKTDFGEFVYCKSDFVEERLPTYFLSLINFNDYSLSSILGNFGNYYVISR